jgi:DNA-binding PadR family transcriptional regulator
MDTTELTQVETVTLAAVADRPRYGYELVQRIAELTDGRLSLRPGNLYRVLHRLEQRGLVIELSADEPGDARRRYFAATDAGRRAAAFELTMYARVLQRIPSLGEEAAGA